jgi:hypothetical protein
MNDARTGPDATPATATADPSNRRRAIRIFALAVLLLAVASIAVAMLAGFGSRWEWWHFRTGFALLRWAVFGALAAIPLGLIAFTFAVALRGTRAALIMAGAAVFIAVLVAVNVLQWRARGTDAPPIHDISTDTENPPQFVAIAPLRADAPNPVEYAGDETAAHQRAAYPDIVPLLLRLPPEQAFERALDAARRMSWEIVATEPAEGRIEATDRTFWFGFYDDVVIRVAPADVQEAGALDPAAAAAAAAAPAASRIDVRSKSRVGRGDVGTNARRIRAYLDRIAVD